jgi:hypothetical protein
VGPDATLRPLPNSATSQQVWKAPRISRPWHAPIAAAKYGNGIFSSSIYPTTLRLQGVGRAFIFVCSVVIDAALVDIAGAGELRTARADVNVTLGIEDKVSSAEHPNRTASRWQSRHSTMQQNMEAQMADLLQWRQRLESTHKQLLDAMTELITNKNYSEAERILYVVDKLMLDLIEDMGGTVVRSGLWT